MAEMKNKGVVFTVGLALLALAVLSLSTTTLVYRQRMQDLVYSMAAVERVRNSFNSIGADLRGIVLKTSGIGIQLNGGVVLFNETIPNSQAAAYQSVLDLYGGFAANNTDNIILDLNGLRNTLTLAVQPSGLNYTHDFFGGREVRINPSSVNFNRYSVSIYSPENITNCTWNIPAGNNTLMLDFYIRGSPGACNLTLLADPSMTSSFDVNGGSLVMTVGSGGRLSIRNNWLTAVNVSTGVYLTNVSGSLMGIYLPEGIVRASLPEHGVSKGGRVKLI